MVAVLKIIDYKAIWRESMAEEAKPTTTTASKQSGPQFIPKLRGKKVIIRLVSVGQPITGIVDGYNAYEILIKTAKGEILVFKHAIAIMEPADIPKQQDFVLKRMTSSSQSPRDRILWTLTNSGRKMERSRRRRCSGWIC